MPMTVSDLSPLSGIPENIRETRSGSPTDWKQEYHLMMTSDGRTIEGFFETEVIRFMHIEPILWRLSASQWRLSREWALKLCAPPLYTPH